MEHQDWSQTVLGKRPSASQAVAKEAYKQLSRTTHEVAVARKLDRDTESTGDPEKVGIKFGQALQQARLAKKLSQDDLAKTMAVKKDIVQSYESGRAVPQPHIIARMQSVLGCKLPKPSISKPADTH